MADENNAETEEIADAEEVLPEGFFDDPKMDAKVCIEQTGIYFI